MKPASALKPATTLAIAFVGLGVAGVLLMRSVLTDPATTPASTKTTGAAAPAAPAQPALPAVTAPTTPRGGIAGFDCTRPSGAAARVDGVTLQLADLCTRLAAFGAVMKGGTDRTQAKLVLDRMIDATLVRNALAQKRITVDPKKLGDATGILREQLRERLELETLAEIAPVTEADIDAEIARGAPGVDRGEGTEVEGWLLRVAPNDIAGRAKAKERIDGLAHNPETMSAKQGLTAIPPFLLGTNIVEKGLEEAAGKLPKGKWSEPIETRVGWAVIRVRRQVDGMELTDPLMRARIRRALEVRRLAQHKQTLEDLRAAARVEIFVDV